PLLLAGEGATPLTKPSPPGGSGALFCRPKRKTALCSVPRFFPPNGPPPRGARIPLCERRLPAPPRFSLVPPPDARLPSRRMVTIEGVHFWPSWLGTTSAWPNWKFATTELLVPKSIPMYGMLPPIQKDLNHRGTEVQRRRRQRRTHNQNAWKRCFSLSLSSLCLCASVVQLLYSDTMTLGRRRTKSGCWLA